MSLRKGKKMKWVIIGIGVILLTLGGLFIRSGGRIIAFEYDYFPKERIESSMSTAVTEGELELSGALRVTAGSSRLARRFLPGTFLADVQVNGRKVNLIIDTGSNLTVLAPRVAMGAKVTLTNKVGKAFHWGKEVPIYQGQVQELEIKGLIARNVPVAVWGLQPTLKVLGLPIYRLDGFLGMNLLKHLAIRLNLQKGTITFSREPLSSPPEVPSAPLQVLEKGQEEGLPAPLPIVEGFLRNFGPFTFLIDTGASGPALVGEEIWQALGLGKEKRATLAGVQLGAIVLEKVPAVKGSGAEFWKNVILLGNNIFLTNGYKRLTLDFLAGKLYAER